MRKKQCGEVDFCLENVLAELHYWREAQSVVKVSGLLPWAPSPQGRSETSSFSCLLITLLWFCLQQILTKANLLFMFFSCLSPPRSLWVCGGCCVRAKTHPSLMSLYVHTHKVPQRTHTAPTHSLALWTGLLKPGRSQPSQAEQSVAHLEPEDVNRDRAAASGQAQQYQTRLQEER